MENFVIKYNIDESMFAKFPALSFKNRFEKTDLETSGMIEFCCR